MDIPLELLEQFERGNVLLFVGERIARAVDGQAWIDRLSAALTARCVDLAGLSPVSFPEAAQAYEDAHGRQALVQFLREQFETPTAGAPSAPRLIAGLTACEVLATTCIDRQLEAAFAAANRPLNVVTGNVDVAFADARQATLYKLRGALAQPESLVLTEDDYEAFFDDQTSLSLVLQAHLATKTVLFVGYDLDDPHFKRLYRKVTAPLDNYARRAYAFGDTPPPQVCRWCERHGINVISADATTFLEALTVQLAARKRPAPLPTPSPAVTAGAVTLPVRPYKLLDYYEAQDAAIFFGRQAETRQLTSLIHAHRLVLLYGASGTGKTSLLLAGAVPRLEAADPAYAAVYVRALEDPADVIRRAVERKLQIANSEWRMANERASENTEYAIRNTSSASLVDFLHTATQTLGCPLVIILDQFEEFFIRLSPEFRRAFVAELGALYDARDVPVKIVLSLREDWLASINELEQRIPEVFRTRMRLLPLTREQAREAITAPVGRLGVTYEPALVERLLDDLTGETAIMPPQLQLVCSALYDGLPAGQTQIALAAYKALGGARGVLQAYLDAELARLPASEQALARDLLEELVTSERTKAVKTGADLALALGVNVAALAPVLEKLVRARLLRVLETAGTTYHAYELAHEYLIAEIALSPEAVARKEAEELLRQGVENYRRFEALLSQETLTLIAAQRDRLRLDADAQALLLRSALRYGRDVGDWLAQMEDEGVALELAQATLLAPEGAAARQNLATTATALSTERRGALVTRLADAWQGAKRKTQEAGGKKQAGRRKPSALSPQSSALIRTYAADALWALRPYLPRRLRLKLQLARAPQTLRRIALPLAGVVVGALVIALVVWGPRWLTPKPDIAWVDIPAGTFRMGSDPAVDSQAYSDEMPQHDVTLDAFRIGTYEVTNADYAQCVKATVCNEPADTETYLDIAYAWHPVVTVSWYDAKTFCEWVGGRLPTEAEWEYAARGDTGYVYPWGNTDPTCELANYYECGGDTMPVGSLPDGASPFGAMDMAGNVWEWTADWYGEYSEEMQYNPTGPERGDYRVLRGGSFDGHPSYLRASNRSYDGPVLRDDDVGFRCVRESPGK